MGGLDRMMQNRAQHGLATGDPDADALLAQDGNALLLGVLLDQQMRAEIAFSGPLKLRQRLGHLDMQQIADMDADRFAALCREKPAVHRFANMMAGRVQNLARVIAADYGGEAARLWNDGAEEATIRKRAGKLPGFGAAKLNTLLHALDLFGHRKLGQT